MGVATPSPAPGVRTVRRRLRVEPLHHVPALDGLRAVAVALVLLYHAGFEWMRGGFLGVSVFFTLSGFLITSLLLREWNERGRIDGRRFWVRRLRRLSPAAWTAIALILVLAAVGAWDDTQLRSLRGDVPWSLLDLVNWHFVAEGASYGAGFGAPSPLEHYWSLAVETQFYAVLLLVVLGVLALRRRFSPRARVRTLTQVLAALTVASVAASWWLGRGSLDRAYFGTDTRAAEMLLGALLACALLRRLQLPPGRAREIARVGGPVALAIVVGLSTVATTGSAWLHPWGLLLTGLCSTLVVASCLQGGAMARALATRPLVLLGRISYGVYVLHWPLFLWLTPHRTGLDGWALFGLRMLVTLPAAYVLHRAVEEPVRARAWPRPGRGVRVAPAAALSLGVLALVLTRDLPPAPAYLDTDRGGEMVVREATDEDEGSPPTTAPGPRTPQRVLLVGDSIAASLEDALSDAFAERGISFASIARPGCGVVVGVPATGPGQPVREMGGVDVSQCESSLADTQRASVRGFRPDLVLTMSTWEQIDRTVDDVWYGFGTPESDAKLQELYGQTIERLAGGGAGVAMVLLPDNVAGRNAPFGGPTDEHLERAAHLRELQRRIAEQRAGVTTLDMASIVCPESPCPTEIRGLELRPGDGMHYDEPLAAAWVAAHVADLALAIDLDDLGGGPG